MWWIKWRSSGSAESSGGNSGAGSNGGSSRGGGSSDRGSCGGSSDRNSGGGSSDRSSGGGSSGGNSGGGSSDMNSGVGSSGSSSGGGSSGRSSCSAESSGGNSGGGSLLVMLSLFYFFLVHCFVLDLLTLRLQVVCTHTCCTSYYLYVYVFPLTFLIILCSLVPIILEAEFDTHDMYILIFMFIFTIDDKHHNSFY